MKINQDDTFWSFSLDCYRRPGASDCLIELQDNFGLDVNILLFCCWCGTTGRLPIDELLLSRISNIAGPWQHQVVKRLRKIRREMKEGIPGISAELSNPLREKLKQLELEGELIQQTVMADVAPTPSQQPSAAAVRAALMLYVEFSDSNLSRLLRAKLLKLTNVCGL